MVIINQNMGKPFKRVPAIKSTRYTNQSHEITVAEGIVFLTSQFTFFYIYNHLIIYFTTVDFRFIE